MATKNDGAAVASWGEGARRLAETRGDLRNRRHRASLDRGTFRYPGPHTTDGRENGVPSSSAGLLC